MAHLNTNANHPRPLFKDVKKPLMEPKTKRPRPGIVLDMGEASREEGFRLNGCR